MSTKDLSRTVIEGGRYYGNCDDRRRSHGQARRKVRASLGALANDPSRADGVVLPRTKWVGVSQRDNLGPAERWLRSHVGRPWRVVESEIRAAFDTRTIAGQHVVFDHLLPDGSDLVVPRWHRADTGWQVSRRWWFSVDEAGILRAEPRRPWRRAWTPQASTETKAWLGGRRVREHGERPYWLLATGRIDVDGVLSYRQGRALDAAEAAHWKRLPDVDRRYATTRPSIRAERLDELVRVGDVMIAAGNGPAVPWRLGPEMVASRP